MIMIGSIINAQPIITMIADGDETGGTPKVIEIYANGTVDFSQYSLQNQNNSSTTWGNTFSLSPLGTITDDFVYIFNEGSNAGIFDLNFPGIQASQKLDATSSSVLSINGDDRVRIVDGSSNVVDIYGVDGQDGTGTAWEYKDGYAKRNNATGPDTVFNVNNWSFNNGSLNGHGAVQDGNTYESIIGIGTYTPANSTTSCSSPIIPDYTQNFDNFRPACWTEAFGMPGNLYYNNAHWTNDGWLNNGTTGAARIYIHGNQMNEWLISPQFDISAGGYELSFAVGITSFSNSGGVTMGQDDFVKLMGTVDGITWVPLITWDANNSPSNSGNYYVIDLNPFTALGIGKVAFFASSGTVADPGYNFYIDYFNIVSTGCQAPTQLNTIINGSTAATLTWTDNTMGSAQYFVEWKETNSSTWYNATTAAGATSYALTGLNADQEYQWRLTALCSSSSSSAIVTGNNFIPTCVPIVPDYLENFNNYLSECWTEGRGNLVGYNVSNYRWTNDGFLNNGTTGAARITLYVNQDDAWLISPVFNLSGGNYEVRMNVGITKFSGSQPSAMGADDEVDLMITTDGGNTWQLIYSWNQNNSPSNNGDLVQIPLSNYNVPEAQFAIVASDGSVADLAYNFYVDDFGVFSAGSNLKPVNIIKPNKHLKSEIKVVRKDNNYNIFTLDEKPIEYVKIFDFTGIKIFSKDQINKPFFNLYLNNKNKGILIAHVKIKGEKSPQILKLVN